MLALGDEALEVLLRLRDRVRPRYADGVEAVAACDLAQRGLDAGSVQKSRSA
jgi:hypothetical protein